MKNIKKDLERLLEYLRDDIRDEEERHCYFKVPEAAEGGSNQKDDY